MLSDSPAVVATLSDSPAVVATLSLSGVLDFDPMAYDVGDTAQLNAIFKNTDGALVDPAVLSVTVHDPSSVNTVYTYPSANLIRIGQGQYRGLFPIALAGSHLYRWAGTGANAVVENSSFSVPTPPF